MTTLDQVRLLEEKVEGAVAKLQQLQAENDALRNKCAELTNALSSKTEQLSSYTTDQNEIEDGIKKALDRLNFIENAVLKSGAASPLPNTSSLTSNQVPQQNHSQVITPGSSSSGGILQKATSIQQNNDNVVTENFHTMKIAEQVQTQNSVLPEETPSFHEENLQQAIINSSSIIENQQVIQEQPIIQDDFNNSDDSEGDEEALGFDIF